MSEASRQNDDVGAFQVGVLVPDDSADWPRTSVAA